MWWYRTISHVSHIVNRRRAGSESKHIQQTNAKQFRIDICANMSCSSHFRICRDYITLLSEVHCIVCNKFSSFFFLLTFLKFHLARLVTTFTSFDTTPSLFLSFSPGITSHTSTLCHPHNSKNMFALRIFSKSEKEVNFPFSVIEIIWFCLFFHKFDFSILITSCNISEDDELNELSYGTYVRDTNISSVYDSNRMPWVSVCVCCSFFVVNCSFQSHCHLKHVCFKWNFKNEKRNYTYHFDADRMEVFQLKFFRATKFRDFESHCCCLLQGKYFAIKETELRKRQICLSSLGSGRLWLRCSFVGFKKVV